MKIVTLSYLRLLSFISFTVRSLLVLHLAGMVSFHLVIPRPSGMTPQLKFVRVRLLRHLFPLLPLPLLPPLLQIHSEVILILILSNNHIALSLRHTPLTRLVKHLHFTQVMLLLVLSNSKPTIIPRHTLLEPPTNSLMVQRPPSNLTPATRHGTVILFRPAQYQVEVRLNLLLQHQPLCHLHMVVFLMLVVL